MTTTSLYPINDIAQMHRRSVYAVEAMNDLLNILDTVEASESIDASEMSLYNSSVNSIVSGIDGLWPVAVAMESEPRGLVGFIKNTIRRVWEFIKKSVLWILDKLGFEVYKKKKKKKKKDLEKLITELKSLEKEESYLRVDPEKLYITDAGVLAPFHFFNQTITSDIITSELLRMHETIEFIDSIRVEFEESVLLYSEIITTFGNFGESLKDLDIFSKALEGINRVMVSRTTEGNARQTNARTMTRLKGTHTFYNKEIRAYKPFLEGDRVYVTFPSIPGVPRNIVDALPLSTLQRRTFPENHTSKIPVMTGIEIQNLIGECLNLDSKITKAMEAADESKQANDSLLKKSISRTPTIMDGKKDVNSETMRIYLQYTSAITTRITGYALLQQLLIGLLYRDLEHYVALFHKMADSLKAETMIENKRGEY